MFAISLALILSAAVQLNCDLPGGNRSSQVAASAEACAAACVADQGCPAWSFVSGWNRCFFKSKTTKPSKLRIHAAQIVRGARGERLVGKVFEDHDCTGKDLRRVSGISDAQACGQQCQAETECESFAYLDGYRDCWLKKNQGRLIPKVFYCGFRY